MAEIHLIVLWEKARAQEERVLEDIRRHMTIVAVIPQRWPGDPRRGFEKFYGAKARLARGKVESCGGGEFLSVIVRDDLPRYGWARTSHGTEYVDLRMLAMKNRYRRWVGGNFVHSTNSAVEAARDVFLLTGRRTDDWLADGSVSGLEMFSAGTESVLDPGVAIRTCFDPVLERADQVAELCMRALPVRELLSPREVMRLPDGMYTELVFDGRTGAGVPCEISYVTDGRELLEQDWDLSCRFRSVAPLHGRRALFFRMDSTSEDFGVFVRERVDGMTLAEAVRQGMSPREAEHVAEELTEIAEALAQSGICHRNLRPSELLVGNDGHVRVRDFRFAIGVDDKWETRWFSRNPRMLAALGGGYRESSGVWNDCLALARCMEILPEFPARANRIAELLSRRTPRSCHVRFRPKYRARAFFDYLKIAAGNAWRFCKRRRRKDLDLQRLLACVCGCRPSGDDGWHDVGALFRAMNAAGIRYAVIRNFETLPDDFDPSLHGDIDFLVEDEAAVAAFMRATKAAPQPYRVHYLLTVGGRPVRVDLRHVGDDYYCEDWERAILANRRLISSGVFVPSAVDAFHALVYHAVFQKFEIAPDYQDKIAALASEAGISGSSIEEWVKATVGFLRAHGYSITRPADKTVKYNEQAIAEALKTA